jgi:hypothetical protein
MNEQPNIITILNPLFEALTAHIVERTVHAIGPSLKTLVQQSVTEALDDSIDLAGMSLSMAAMGDMLNKHTARLDAISTSSDEQIVQVVENYLDDNRTLGRMDEAIDNLVSRVDDLENDDNSGLPRKHREYIDDAIQDKLDSTEFITAEGLADKVAEILDNGSFSVSFSRYP